MVYSFCIFTILSFSGCKCPFCCQDSTKVKSQEQTKFSTTASKTIEPTSATKSTTTHLTITSKEQFEKEVLQASQPVIVDFSADWCVSCKASQPTFDAVAEQLSSTYKFVTVNVNQAEQVAQELGIQGIPTFIFFKNGKEVNRITGAITKKEEFISTIETTFGK
jgi:thioredoxin 1